MKMIIICISLTMALASLAAAESKDQSVQVEPTGLSIKQLLNGEVYSTSKFTQKTSKVSDTLTIFTLTDVKSYGYRKLVGILSSWPGLTGV